MHSLLSATSNYAFTRVLSGSVDLCCFALGACVDGGRFFLKTNAFFVDRANVSREPQCKAAGSFLEA